jgi:hypothetical protein
LVAYQAGETQKAIDEASVAITNGFKSGADGVETLNTALQAVNGPGLRETLSSAEGLSKGLDDLAKISSGRGVAGFDSFGGSIRRVAFRTTEAAGLEKALTAVGSSLGNLATTNLPAAQTGFANFARANNLSRTEQMTALGVMGEYRTALVDQAAQMGINIYNTEGLVDDQLLLNFALGEGEIAQRNATAAAAEATLEYHNLRVAQNDSAMAALGWKDALKTAVSEVNGEMQFSLEDAIKNMHEILETNKNFSVNMFTLQTKGVSNAALQAIRDAGAAGPTIAAELVTKTDAELAEFSAPFETAALQSSEAFSAMEKSITENFQLGKIGADQAAALMASLYNSKTEADILAVGRGLRSSLIEGLLSGGTIEVPFKLRGTGFSTGGLVRVSSGGFLEDGVIKAAVGGLIRGVGTATSDSIPAFLSNGEYVINARSTARYKPLLDAINSGVIGSSVAPSPTSVTGGTTYSPEINITVNPSAGMDERELAKLVSKEIAYSMRKGAMS